MEIKAENYIVIEDNEDNTCTITLNVPKMSILSTVIVPMSLKDVEQVFGGTEQAADLAKISTVIPDGLEE